MLSVLAAATTARAQFNVNARDPEPGETGVRSRTVLDDVEAGREFVRLFSLSPFGRVPDTSYVRVPPLARCYQLHRTGMMDENRNTRRVNPNIIVLPVEWRTRGFGFQRGFSARPNDNFR